MNIKNVDGLTREEIKREIDNGARFVVYQYTISVILLTFKRSSDIYFVRSDQKRILVGLPFTLISVVLGWWGIPWGPIYTIQGLIKNLSGGMDVTQHILPSFTGSELAAEPQAL